MQIVRYWSWSSTEILISIEMTWKQVCKIFYLQKFRSHYSIVTLFLSLSENLVIKLSY